LDEETVAVDMMEKFKRKLGDSEYLWGGGTCGVERGCRGSGSHTDKSSLTHYKSITYPSYYAYMFMHVYIYIGVYMYNLYMLQVYA